MIRGNSQAPPSPGMIPTRRKLSAKIENAADEKYQIVNGYNTPEASGYITIEWQQ